MSICDTHEPLITNCFSLFPNLVFNILLNFLFEYRLIQNRESAKKSRLKKKEEQMDMTRELEQLQSQSKQMKVQVSALTFREKVTFVVYFSFLHFLNNHHLYWLDC